MEKMHKILLIPNTSKRIFPDDVEKIIARWKSNGCAVATLPEYTAFLGNILPAVKELEKETWDAACILGGDGSILDAAHRLLGTDIPLVGINFGHVGYLAQLEISELSLIDKIAQGAYDIEERLMLGAQVYTASGELRQTFTCLNDVVMTNGPVARILSFDVFCNGVPLQNCRADGMIVATPTGSTAYSLSAGGPILDPAVECICLTPICSHTLNSRPVILQGGAEITIRNIVSKSTNVYLTCDGRDALLLQMGDYICVKRSHINTKLIRAKDNSFLDTVQRKLSDNTLSSNIPGR